MMRRKIERMARGYRSKRRLVLDWNRTYHPMADIMTYRDVTYWTWEHPTQSIPLAELRRIQAYARERSTPI